jgi:ribonuclease HII
LVGCYNEFMITVGIDEVGRGCWAGPVVAGAVILAAPLAGLTDSKLLTKHRRQQLAAEIQRQATAIGLGWVAAPAIDELGLTAAVQLAMRRALAAITISYDEIIIDGNHNFLADNPKARAIIKADFSVAAVSAASIVAKVARDTYMAGMAAQYPGYGFERHVGYGTTVHLEALRRQGLCALHRLSYKPVRDFL